MFNLSFQKTQNSVPGIKFIIYHYFYQTLQFAFIMVDQDWSGNTDRDGVLK